MKKIRAGFAGHLTWRLWAVWALLAALVALVAYAPGARAATSHVKAHAAYARGEYGRNCGANVNYAYGPTAGAWDQNSQLSQTTAMREDIESLCGNTWAQLGDVSDALGVYSTASGTWAANSIGSQLVKLTASIGVPASGVWPANTLGALLDGMSAQLAQTGDDIGSCPTTGTIASCESHGATLASYARRQLDAASSVLPKLDTLHADLQAIASNTTPASTSAPGSTTSPPGTMTDVSLSEPDRALSTDNQAELASILWVIAGALAGLPVAHALLREVLAS